MIKGNLQGFRWILQAQRAHDLRFSRVIYFFPIRGPPERADGHLQEEIKVMHGFFGQKIFDLMVVVVTNNHLINRLDLAKMILVKPEKFSSLHFRQ